MATTHHPITAPPGLCQVGLDRPAPNLHLHADCWQASCPTCGYVMVKGRTQATVERKATRTSCPVCDQVA